MALPLPIVSQSLERSAGVDRYAATTFILRVVLTTMIALLPLIAVSAAPAEARQPFDHARLASTALAAHILPGYRRLERAAVALSQTLDRACPATSRARRKPEPALPWLPIWVATLDRAASSRIMRASSTVCTSGF